MAMELSCQQFNFLDESELGKIDADLVLTVEDLCHPPEISRQNETEVRAAFAHRCPVKPAW